MKRPKLRSGAPAAPKLSPRQQDLYDALAEQDRKRRDRGLKDEKLAEMYHGSFYAEAQIENPDRFAQAAQSLRELMDKLPKYCSNVPVVKKPQPLGWIIKEVLKVQLDKIKKDSSCFKDGQWSGEIDDPTQEFHKQTVKMIEDFMEWDPPQKQQAKNVLTPADPLAPPLPDEIEKRKIRAWIDCNEFFQKVAHHNHSTGPEDFSSWRDSLEGLLLDRFAPAPLEARDVLKRIVIEGETNA